MDWLLLSLTSALFLGVYDLGKKTAVDGNAVLPVLFLCTLFMALAWLPLMLVARAQPGALPAGLTVAALPWDAHLRILLKSTLVAGSWILSYFALKHLPVSLASPIRATGPLWTLAGALLVLGERPGPLQGAGIAVTLASFIALSLGGRREGIHFHRNGWVGLMLAGTLLGAASALYDKHLLGRLQYPVPAVQAWFSVYLTLLFTPFLVGWWRSWWPRGAFHWRWSIPVVGVSLLVADYAYFSALSHPEALVSVVSSVRRANVLIAFAGAVWLLREGNVRAKLPGVLGILAGVTLIALG